eukprot:GFKZ01012560.1.p1 GENE.GFKZ01012560.1~~GFKZ01012560.1.p1  ORF type:complete len:399 (+),score=46.68 GFKZ01012560.1:295-1491(+)
MGKGNARKRGSDLESEYSSDDSSRRENSPSSPSPSPAQRKNSPKSPSPWSPLRDKSSRSQSPLSPLHEKSPRSPSPSSPPRDKSSRSPSPSPAQRDKSPRSPSPASSEAASDDAREASPPLPEETEDTAEYEPMKLQVMGRPFSQDLLTDEDNELWLVRIPHHDTFIKALDDRDIHVIEKEGSAGRRKGSVTGRLKGYYVFGDSGVVDKNQRAVFVTKGRDGRERMEIAKPFARSMQVAFGAPLKNQSDRAPPPREYPVSPKGLTLKYRPIGSETATAPNVPKGSIFLTSPTRKRKLSTLTESEASEPAIPDLARASIFSSTLNKRRNSDHMAIDSSLPLTPEQKSPFQRSVATPEEKSPSQQGSLPLSRRETVNQGSHKSPRRKKSETRRRLKRELT